MPKILIVENNPENRDSLAGRLECRGFTVVMAGDGKAGVAMVKTEKPDLVLMEINMPEMDGWEATRQIREFLGCDELPIIVVLEQSMPGDADRALGLGCADSLVKPIEFPQLLGQIETTLQKRPTLEGPLLASVECLPG